MNCVYIIPSLEPDEKIVALVRSMHELGMTNILVVNDGSPAAFTTIFEALAAMGCRVLHHTQNIGKGAAIKTAIRSIETDSISGFVTVDSDGQHKPEDVLRVARKMESDPSCLVLGVRSLKQAHVPFKSRYGNAFSSLFFRLRTGRRCRDTQTGLRGIPIALREMALAVPGNRFDYEMNFLIEAAEKNVDFAMLPIDTVYENKNCSTHFRAVRDAALIYRQPIRYALASLAGAAVDLGLFALLSALGLSGSYWRILAATATARLSSGAVNFLLNKLWSFHSRGKASLQAVKYGVLFAALMVASAGFVALLTELGLPSLGAKILVDGTLFFVSYAVQKYFIFVRG